MDITVHLTDVSAQCDPQRHDDGRTTKSISGTSETTIADIGKTFRIMCYSIEFERYYRVRDINCREGTVPFIISNGRVSWTPSVQTVTVADFLATHSIESNEIYIRHGWAAAGGIGWIDIPTLWEDVYHLFVFASPLIAAGQVSIPALRWIVNRLRDKASPGSVFALVASRPRWTAIDLAELADLSPDESKKLLQLCRYEYDRHTHMYSETPGSEEVFARLNQQKWTIKSGRTPHA